jgi:hypothetical protein
VTRRIDAVCSTYGRANPNHLPARVNETNDCNGVKLTYLQFRHESLEGVEKHPGTCMRDLLVPQHFL